MSELPLTTARLRLQGRLPALDQSPQPVRHRTTPDPRSTYQRHRDRGGCGRCGQPSKRAYCPVCVARTASQVRLKRSGVSEAQYAQAFLEQGGRCLICAVHQSKLKKALAADHNRHTGQFRGLLCGRCNLGIGLFEDNLIWLVAAIRHIALHKGSLSDTGAQEGTSGRDRMPSLAQIKAARKALGTLRL